MKRKPDWQLVAFLIAIYAPAACLVVWCLLTLFPLAGWAGVR